MKMSLFLSRVVTERTRTGLYSFKGHFIDRNLDPRGVGTHFSRLLDPGPPIRFVLASPAVLSVDDELSAPVSSDGYPGCGDSLPLSRKGSAGLAFLLYHPGSVGAIDMHRLGQHDFIVRAGTDAPELTPSKSTPRRRRLWYPPTVFFPHF